jgi:hypothetical protein
MSVRLNEWMRESELVKMSVRLSEWMSEDECKIK